jgi:AcrR family transcriptional regulator
MVQITHTGHNVEMLESILITAQKRFGQYGLAKTTMQEIADDIGMSKGSIYYYFPDKQQLYMAVIDREYEQFLAIVNIKLSSLTDPAEMLRQYSALRLQRIGSLLNLSRISNDEMQGLKSLMAHKWQEYRSKEREVICGILKMGISSGQFEKREPVEVANLFLDLLKSLRLSILKHKEFIYLEPEEFETLVKKQSLLAEIFVAGLRIRKNK